MYPQYYVPPTMQMPQYLQPQMQVYHQHPVMQQQPVQQATPQAPVISNSSTFVRVQSEEEMKNYPVEPNHSVIFKDDNAPYIYTKTMDASQLSQPIYEKYRLVKEDDENKANEHKTVEIIQNDAYKEDIQAIKEDIAFIKSKLTEAEKKKKPVAVKGGETDE